MFCTVWLLVPSLINAQDFTLDWFAVASGGGESSGGDFELSASIGQHDAAGEMQGGDFALVGGFWSFVTAVETQGAPALLVTLTGSDVTITWPESGSEEFTLEEASSLLNPSASTTWTRVMVAPNTSDGVKAVRLPIAGSSRFYRLHKP
jgi:hypothetical protein